VNIQRLPKYQSVRKEGVDVYTLVKINPRRTDENCSCRQELTVRSRVSRESLGGCLVHSYQGCGEGLLVDSMSCCFVDVRVYRTGLQGLEVVEEVERLTRSTEKG